MPVFEGYKWAAQFGQAQVQITWSFATMNYSGLSAKYSGYKNFDSQVSDQYKSLVEAAFYAWEKVANVDFIESMDAASVDIRIGNLYIDGNPEPGQTSTTAITKSWYTGGIESAAEIYFDADAYKSNADFYQTALHEIGHALGLDHSSDPANIMYYMTNPMNISGKLSPDDIAGAVQLYGAAAASAPSTLGSPSLTAISAAPAVAVTAFIAGMSPTSSDYANRANFALEQYNYYSAVLKVANPLLGPYEALGRAFADTAEFKVKFGLDVDTTSSAFVSHAYQAVFLTAPTAAQQSSFLSQVNFFVNLYKSVGIADASAQIQARGAVVGQMIGYDMTDTSISAKPGNLLDDQVAAFLVKVNAGNTSVFGQPWSTATSSAAVQADKAVSTVGFSEMHALHDWH